MLSGKRQRKKPKYLRDEEEEDDGTTEEVREKEVKEKEVREKDPPKSKKHKKEKKNKKVLSAKSEDGASKELAKPGIKLKFKLGGETVGTSVTTASSLEQDSGSIEAEDTENIDVEGDFESDEQLSKPQNDKTNDDETSDEEREWLEAVESGDLEHYEKKKAEKNPALLTARQRALLHGEADEQLLELPTAYKSAELTEEQLQRRKQRAVKRRQQAIEKREKAKKQTVDRLLKKQDSSLRGRGAKSGSSSRKGLPHLRYIISSQLCTVSLPPDVKLPLVSQNSRSPKAPTLCGVEGCNNLKKYSCSKTNEPICSLECYKKNLSSHRNADTNSVT